MAMHKSQLSDKVAHRNQIRPELFVLHFHMQWAINDLYSFPSKAHLVKNLAIQGLLLINLYQVFSLLVILGFLLDFEGAFKGCAAEKSLSLSISSVACSM
jgi:hypothetical protein